jgi:carboxylate-amine ligase
MRPTPTIGVEEELALVDLRTGALTGKSDQVLDRIDDDVPGLVEHELKVCQVETASPVCSDLDSLATSLRSLRAAAADAAARVGCGVLAAGTHPTSSWKDQAVTARTSYRQLEQDYQRLADEQVVFGCHVHVGIDDPDLRIAVLDRVRPWLSVLLALSANSPFWEGEDTGYASYRYVVFSRWPTFGPPEPLGDWAGFESVVQTLQDSEAIDGPQRLYWTARPSATYPTIEFRIADVCPTVDDAVVLAGLARGLAMAAIDDVDRGTPCPDVPSTLLRSAEWRAARYGLDDGLLDPVTGTERPAGEVVAQLLDHVGPSLERTGEEDRVRADVAALIARGTGADRQRSADSMASDRGALVRSLIEPTRPTSSC